VEPGYDGRRLVPRRVVDAVTRTTADRLDARSDLVGGPKTHTGRGVAEDLFEQLLVGFEHVDRSLSLRKSVQVASRRSTSVSSVSMLAFSPGSGNGTRTTPWRRRTYSPPGSTPTHSAPSVAS